MKPVRWVVKFLIEPGQWVKAGGHPKWSPAKIHKEALRVYGPHYTGRFLPPHLKSKPRFIRLAGTKDFVRLNRMPDLKVYRIA